MSKYDWIVGIDLGKNEAQISIDDEAKNETLPEHIPIALLCKADGQTWLAGSDAIAAAFDGGDLKEGFIGRDAALLRIFICALLEMAGVQKDAYARTALTVTASDLSPEVISQLKDIGAVLFPVSGAFKIISHTQAYEYYAIAQKKELWARDVGLFEYDHDGLRYHHLTVKAQSGSGYLAADEVSLRDVMDGSEIGKADEASMDEKFSQAIGRVIGGRQITTFYLVGEGFEETEDGKIWMNQSLQKLCAYRRHVFVGQNLYATGARMCSRFMANPEEKPDMIFFDTRIAPKEIYLLTLHDRKAVKTVLLPAGDAWYNAGGTLQVVIGSTDHLIIRIRDVLTGAEKRLRLRLDGLPERPPRTTQLRLTAGFVSERQCLLTAEDEGFGTFFPSSGKRFELAFDIDEPVMADDSLKEEGFVIEVRKAPMADAMSMPVTGVQVENLQQLCWYIQANTDIMTTETFDERLLSWMTQVTGDHSLSDYVRSGKTCREMTRRLLSSVDYFSNQEINTIAERIVQLEKLSANERGKRAADTCMRNGKYMAALRGYHHLTVHMGAERQEFQAAVWHNMGLACLRLQNSVQAVDCMKKARDVSGAEGDQLDYLRMLLVTGDRQSFDEEVRKTGLPDETAQMLERQVQHAREAFPASERGRRVREGIEMKHERRMADYSDFVQSFVEARRLQYIREDL